MKKVKTKMRKMTSIWDGRRYYEATCPFCMLTQAWHLKKNGKGYMKDNYRCRHFDRTISDLGKTKLTPTHVIFSLKT